MVDYYELLQVSPSSTTNEIRTAYRKAAMQWHPDRNQGSRESEEKFKDINQAYSVLSDPQKRAQYNEFCHSGQVGYIPTEPIVDFESATRIFIYEMYSLAAELTMQNIHWRNIGSALIGRGCPPTVANAIAFEVETVRKAQVRTAAWRAFGWALFWIAIGGAVTGCTYAVASSDPKGGTYLVTWGLFVFGGYNLLRALYYLVTGNAPQSRDTE